MVTISLLLFLGRVEWGGGEVGVGGGGEGRNSEGEGVGKGRGKVEGGGVIKE